MFDRKVWNGILNIIALVAFEFQAMLGSIVTKMIPFDYQVTKVCSHTTSETGEICELEPTVHPNFMIQEAEKRHWMNEHRVGCQSTR